jgi:tagatose 6-phosphate kinase
VVRLIVTVTPNPALDVTYRVAALVPGTVHRVAGVVVRAGGKGVNVARVLHQLGENCAVLGLGGGHGGARVTEELRAGGIEVELVDTFSEVRRTLVVHGTDGVTTSLWEPGPAPADPGQAGEALTGAVRNRLPSASVVTVSGSLPAGVDADLPARIAATCLDAGVPVVLDLDGDPLRVAAESGGAVLMPNSDELEALTGERPVTPADAAALARELVRPGLPGRRPAAAVVATLGADGLVAVSPAGAVHARVARHVDGNATGAGDAACAAVARCIGAAGAVTSVRLHELAARAAAVSAASVVRPVAGEIDLSAYRRYLPHILVEDL